MKKRLFAALALLLVLLGGCKKAPEEETPAPPPAPAEEQTEQAPAPAAYMGGAELTLEDISPYIALSVDNLTTELGVETIDWTEEDTTISDYVKQDALEILRLYTAIESKARELSIRLTPEEEERLQSWHADAVEALGSEKAYAEYLRENHMTEQVYTRIYAVNLLYNHLYDYFYGENGKDIPTDVDIFDWAEQQGIYHISHIFLSTEDCTQQEKIAQMQLAADLNERLRAGEDFYTLAAEYSSGDGMLNQYIRYSDAEKDIQTILSSLEVGDLSGIAESETGYHIILREQVDRDYMLDNFPDLIAQRFNALISAWTRGIAIRTTDLYDGLNVGELLK